MKAIFLLITTLSCHILTIAAGDATTIQVCCPSRNLTYSEEWNYFEARPGANLFYWLYYETGQAANSDRPWFIWLQGGPGSSGTGFGNFEEIGPLDVQLNPRNTTLLSRGDLLFVDSPVGTGYSYVTDDAAYTRDVDTIADDLTNLMISFIANNTQYKERPFYILCESYGGKMAAVFAWHLYVAMRNGKLSMNLKGVGLGDSWISPIDFVDTWPDYLYYFSRLSQQGLSKAKEKAASCDQLVQQGKWEDATNCWSEMEDLIGVLSGDVSWYNVLKQSGQDPWSLSANSKRGNSMLPPPNDDLDNLMNGRVREKLGIIPKGVTWGGQSGEVFTKQAGDFMKPVIDTVDSLLNYTQFPVFVYNGQLDLICDTVGVELWMSKLQWAGLSNFLAAKREPVLDKFGNKELVGFTQQYSNLRFFWILKAGHMAPADTPTAILTMLDAIISG